MRFLRLASNWLDRQDSDAFSWPYWIDVSVSGQIPQVAVAEGVAHGTGGGHFAPATVLRLMTGTIVGAEGQWLIPYIERLAAGDTVTEEELRAEFFARHGREPETYDWDINPNLP